jgi:arsenate reductase (thioredoxin)
MAGKKQKILFLCTGNSCRSQMAEGWARHLHGDRFDVWSAGIEIHGLNSSAVQVMQEAGVDISGHHSKLLKEVLETGLVFDLVITVCGHADENCPLFPGDTQIIYHGFDDPPKLAEGLSSEKENLDKYRGVCEEIRLFVSEL